MTSTAQHTAEAARSAALTDYRLLDNSPERALDRITALAVKIFDVPMAFISFLGEGTLFFRSCFGVDLREQPSEGSFCSYTVQGDEVMVVPDARTDLRFARHPLVTGEPYLRFYAGAPLNTPEGVALGSLCLLDSKPHPVFSDAQRELLSELVEMVMEALEHRRLSAAVVRERAFLEAVLDNVAEGVVACNAEGELTFNQAARTFHGLPASPLEPGDWTSHYDLYEADGSTPLATERIPLLRALHVFAVQGVEMIIATKDAPARQLQANGRPFSDQQGELLGAVVAMRDVTAERAAAAALRESEALHRTVLSALREGVVRQEADGRISSHNPATAAGVVFPALQSGVDAAVKTYSSRGTDVTAFTEEATAEDGTFLFPITDYGSQITSIMRNALENIFISDAEVEPTLTQANEQVNALFQ